MSIVGEALNSPAQGAVEAEHELLVGARHEVGEPFGFKDQPEPFNGIEIGRIGRQEDGLKAAPIEGLRLMP